MKTVNLLKFWISLDSVVDEELLNVTVSMRNKQVPFLPEPSRPLIIISKRTCDDAVCSMG